jgi:hypothetical protein
MHGRLFLGLVILATAVSIGCGGGSTSSQTLSTTSASGGSQNLAAGQLAVSPTKLDFGHVAVGATKSQSVTLTAGPASITVRSAAWSGEGYSVSGIVFPVTIPAGQSVQFKITFAPQTAGSSAGSIKFVSDAAHEPLVAFSGNGAANHSVTLTWEAPVASVAGYNVYRGTASAGPFTKMTNSPHPDPTFTDASVVAGTTYFYMTTAVSPTGKESDHSNQVQVTIPNS